MKVKELIAILQSFDNPDLQVKLGTKECKNIATVELEEYVKVGGKLIYGVVIIEGERVSNEH